MLGTQMANTGLYVCVIADPIQWRCCLAPFPEHGHWCEYSRVQPEGDTGSKISSLSLQLQSWQHGNYDHIVDREFQTGGNGNFSLLQSKVDVNGTKNFFKVKIVTQETAPNDSPRKSYIKVMRDVAKMEVAAMIKLKPNKPAEFHVINPSKTSKVGNPSGYKLVPSSTAARWV